MVRWQSILAALVAAVLSVPNIGIAADETANSAADDATGIDTLIEQLDADQFSQRQRATDELAKLGERAVAPLVKAATGDSLEVTSRAVDVLKRLFESSDEAIQAAAKAGLETLANGSHAPSSRRAKEVLKIKDAAPGDPNVPNANIILGGGGIIQGANIRVQIGGGNAGVKRVSIRNANGVKEIDAEEDGRKVKIVDDPAKGIKMEITTKKDGKDATEKVEAKNAEELKKNNAEAYKIYKEYSDQAPAQAIQLQLGGGLVPVPAPAVPAIQVEPLRVQIDMAKRMLKSWSQSLPRLTGEKELDGASKKSLDELQEGIKEMKQQIAELEKRIEAQRSKPAEKTNEKDAAEKPKAEKADKAEAIEVHETLILEAR